MVPTHHRCSDPQVTPALPCSRPCRDLAGVQPPVSAPEVSLGGTEARPGLKGEEWEGEEESGIWKDP